MKTWHSKQKIDDWGSLFQPATSTSCSQEAPPSPSWWTLQQNAQSAVSSTAQTLCS